MARYVQCDCCGKVWNVSKDRDASKLYVCPECEEKMSGKRRGDK
jgi:predicted RNA-binding Zn-ribbon protein involved in translation (DUF1610 family)